jgi:hypothetical protein
MLTNRDYEIVDFINKFKVANSFQIQKVFNMSQTVANRRLRQIVKNKEIDRMRDYCSMNYLYYTEKPTKHKLIATEFYSRLVNVDIIKFEREYVVGNIRSDIYCECKYNDYMYFMFVEIQLSNIEPDIKKYEDYYYSGDWKEKFKVFPRIIVISDRIFKINSELKIIQINSKMEWFDMIFDIV